MTTKTIDEVKALKASAEIDIRMILRRLEQDTGCTVSHIGTELGREVGKRPEIVGVDITLEV